MADLWDQYQEHRDESTRNELVLANLPLVRFVLGRLPLSLPPDLGEDDLLGAGVVALLRAVEEFQPERGTAFATFAVPRLRGAMLDELRRHDILSRAVRDHARAIERVCAERRRQGRPLPSTKEIARLTGLSPRVVERTLNALGLRTFLSLETAPPDPAAEGAAPLAETTATPRGTTPLAITLARERDRLLAQAVAELPQTERRVVVLYYHHGLLFKEIAQTLGLSKARVSQLHNHALGRLRQHIAPDADAVAGHEAP